MKKLSEDRVKVIDRGPLHMRKGASGLMEYKKKFGPLVIQREINQNNISVANDPLFDMAKEMQGNPLDRKSTRLNSSHIPLSRMPSSA